MWPLLLGTLTMFVFALPLVPAALEWRRARDVRPLMIDGEHTLDVTKVAADFRALVARHEAGDRLHRLTRTAMALRPVVHVTGSFVPTRAETNLGVCTRTVVTGGTLTLPDGFTFSRDIYGRRGVYTGRENHLQVLLSEGELVIRDGSELQRWAHARNIHVEPNCRLRGPVSAHYAIRLEEACEFTSVSAAVVSFGQRRAGTPPDIDDRTDNANAGAAPSLEAIPDADASEHPDGRWLVPHALTLSANTVHRGDLIVHGELWIGAGSCIMGSVKSTGGIWLGPGVRIHGALIAAGAILLERECVIAGPLVSEQEIDVGRRCVIGAAGRRTTVVAPLLHMHAGTVVYGAASALEEGRVVPEASAGDA
ncbi:hypothetical protein D9X30_4474 [Cupriavidus sp. U2]|uniref:hypothetical protein n=1 Tax=Cupriavidus sp. U2 TaxID=2920269 RepID=UPI00129E05DC|nr:hypothetical protein [Cupriavidus sp. U2]KAI3590989.1 hypothetical protein D9X30_4474 [Cupriavidus sp. U2]